MEYRKTLGYFCYLLWANTDKQKQSEDIIVDDAKKEFPLIADFQIDALKRDLKISFLPLYDRKYQASNVNRQKTLFEAKYKDTFMAKAYSFVYPLIAPPVHGKNKGGRPRKSLEDLSIRVKNKRHEEILSEYSVEELKRVVQKRKRSLSEMSRASQSDVEEEDKENKSVDYHQPLALFHDAHLSKLDYKKVRAHARIINEKKVLPCYDKVTEIKKTCFLDIKEIEITDDGASVNIIPLIQHTIGRIMMDMSTENVDKMKKKTSTLIAKWGMDGASGQRTMRHEWSSTISDDSVTDESVFLVTLCPLQIKAGTSVVWQNETSNSPLLCRTVKFTYQKETMALVQKTFNDYSDVINKQNLLEVEFEGNKFQVRLDMKCTMIDGKVCNFISNQKATRSCNLCDVGPASINDISSVISLPISDKKLYNFGLSSLHAKMKCMDYVLHIGYRAECDHRIDEFGRPYVKNSLTREECKEIKESNKKIASDRKRAIQKALRERLRLTVDVVKQGVGTTNCGNVAREFFENPTIVADITGVDESLIIRLHAILQVISSCQYIANFSDLKDYCHETARLFVQLYSWYIMPPSVHKILIHGSDIMRVLGHPCGWFSEEAQEAMNKHFRKARDKSRMTDRKKANEDTLHYLLSFSDPKVHSLRVKDTHKHKELTKEAKQLLIIK